LDQKLKNMRTKTLLFAAALSAASMAASLAQDAVFSVNAVGYVNKTLSPGLNLISNPLNNGDNTLNTIIPDIAPFTTASFFNGSGFDQSLFVPGAGWTPNVESNPGSGFFVDVAAETTVTFVGEVPQGELATEIPAGLSVVSSQVPQAGDLAGDLGFAPGAFDVASVFNGTGFDQSVFVPGVGFSPAVNLEVGQAIFVQAAAPVTWSRTFSVND
jgi:hypothetical protein